MEQTHSLLKRQLKRHLGDSDSLPREWQAMLEAVNTAYLEYDADRRMLERSLELSSQELLQRNSEMRAVFQAFPDLFFRLDADGTIMDYKAGNTTELYLPPEKLLGKRIQDIPLREIGDKFQAAMKQLKETKSPVSMEYSLKIEKQEHFYEARLLPLFENHIIVIVRTITEQKKAEEALRESEDRLKLVVEGAELGTWDQNMITGEVVRNRRWAEILGYTLEEIEARVDAWKALIHPDDLPEVERITRDHRAGRTPFLRCEHRMRTKSGKWKWILNCGKIIERDSEGRPIRAAGTHTDITEHKRTEEALRQSEKKYRTLVESAHEGIGLVDSEENFILVNQAFADALGYKTEELLGLNVSRLCDEDQFTKFRRETEKRRQGQSSRYEARLYTKSGAPKDFSMSAAPLFDENGSFIGTLSLLVDITESKRAKKALQESEKKYSTIVEKGNDGIVIIQDGLIKFANSTMAAITGLNPEEVIGKPFADYVSPAYKAMVMDTYKKRVSGNESPNKYEIEISSKDGRQKPVEVSASLIEYEGRPADMAIIRNISERKQAEEELQRTHFAIDSALEGMAWLDKDFNYTYVNEGMCKMLGYTRDELLSMKPSDLDSMFPQVPLSELWLEMRGVKSQVREGSFRRKDGTTFPAELIIDHVVFKNEEYLFTITRNITDRKRAEEKLRESEERYRDLFDNASDMIQSVDVQGKFVYVNKKWKEVLGYTDEEIGKLHLTDILRKDQIPHCMELFKKVMSGETLENVEVVFATKGGREIFASGFVSPRLKDGKFVSTKAIFRDVTERKRMEEEILSLSKFPSENPSPVIRINRSGEILYRNNAAVELLRETGLQDEDTLKILPSDLNSLMNKAFETKKVISDIEARVGDKIYAYVLTPVPEGGYVNLYGLDITHSKKADELLRTSEAQLSNAMRIAKLGYWEYDVTDDLFTFNDHFYAIFHTTAEQIGGYKMSPARYAQTFLHPDDMPVVAVEMKKALETTDPHFSRQLEHRIIYADGEVGYIAVRFFVVKDDQGRTIKTYGANQDITERKRAEETLRESEERYKALFEGSAEGILITDIETKEFKHANTALCKMLGYTKEELIRMSVMDIHPKDSLKHVISEFEALARGEKTFASYIPCLRKNGKVIYSDISNTRVLIDGRECNVGFFTDITERKKTEEALRKSEHRYRSYIELTNQLAWVTNADGEVMEDILDWRKYTGQSIDEIKGRGWSKAIHPEDAERTIEIWLQAIKTKSIYETEYRVRRYDGIYRHFLARGIPVFNKEGAIQEWVGTCIDVTELKKAEENLRKSMEEAEEANRLKSQFLANMSHEIRTPMNAIIGMTGITLDTKLSDEQREYLRIVKESSYSLLGLLDDILDLSKIEADRVELENIDFDLRDMVEAVIDTLNTRAAAKGLELACFIDSSVHPFLRGDPARLRQILMNLGGNAIKFTEKGEVAIQVELQADTEEHTTLLFSVTDTGIGVPEDKTAEIFESFTQADGSTTRKYGGTGLGLSISKRLVELMKGQIGVESQPAKGSRFWFTVNLEKQKGMKEIRPLVMCDPQGCRILVVDDNQTNRTILIKMLESFKCIPQAVESGKKAIQILKQNYNQKNSFDLILLDMQMPEMDGEETLRLIQNDPLIKQIPVVILTSIGQRGDTNQLEALGAAGYLLKPVKQSQLYDTLITILSKKKKSQTESWGIPKINSHIIPEQKHQRVRLLVAEDNPMNQKLVVTLLKRAGFSVEAVENGKLAMEALKKKTYDLVFMDVQMPEMDGLEATRAIREMEGTRQHTPIIAMTAHVMKGDQERCLEAGMDDYISKPIEPETMFKVIEKWTKPFEIKERVSAVEESKARMHHPDVPLDMETSLKRLDGDINLLKELLSEFLYHASEQVNILEEAIKRSDAKWVVREAHTIKGAAGNLGANNLADSALRLEQLGRTGNLDKGENLIADLQNELERLDEYAHQSLGIESTKKLDIKTEGI